jgi:hypothetical protein
LLLLPSRCRCRRDHSWMDAMHCSSSALCLLQCNPSNCQRTHFRVPYLLFRLSVPSGSWLALALHRGRVHVTSIDLASSPWNRTQRSGCVDRSALPAIAARLRGRQGRECSAELWVASCTIFFCVPAG